MSKIREIFIFILANLTGFMAAPITYHASVLTGWFSPAIIDANPGNFQDSFFFGTMITWALCGVFSFGFFITREKIRNIFLLIPALIPILYGLSILNAFSALP